MPRNKDDESEEEEEEEEEERMSVFSSETRLRGTSARRLDDVLRTSGIVPVSGPRRDNQHKFVLQGLPSVKKRWIEELEGGGTKVNNAGEKMPDDDRIKLEKSIDGTISALTQDPSLNDIHNLESPEDYLIRRLKPEDKKALEDYRVILRPS